MSPSQLNIGGAERVRTDDILNANQVLFQLSYGPLNPSRPACPLRLSASRISMIYQTYQKSTKYDRANPILVPLAGNFSLERR